MMMAIGAYPFSLNTAAYQELSHKSSYRHPKLDRIGRKPARQFLGADSDEISLNGVILPHWKGGWGQLDAMRTIASAGLALPLVSGAGKYFGRYNILSIEEKQSEIGHNGAPLEINFTMTLGEYGEDGFGGGSLFSTIGSLF